MHVKFRAPKIKSSGCDIIQNSDITFCVKTCHHNKRRCIALTQFRTFQAIFAILTGISCVSRAIFIKPTQHKMWFWTKWPRATCHTSHFTFKTGIFSGNSHFCKLILSLLSQKTMCDVKHSIFHKKMCDKNISHFFSSNRPFLSSIREVFNGFPLLCTIIWHDIMTSKKCENDASWSRFCVKICEICYF